MELLPLHTLTQGSLACLLRLEALEQVLERAVSSAHRHDFYEIFLFSKGGGKHMIDFTVYPVLDHSLHVVCPGQVHQVSREALSHGWVLMFSRDFLLSLLEIPQSEQQVAFLRRPPATATTVLPEAIYLLMKMLLEQIQSAQPQGEKDWQNPELVRALAKVIVLKCAGLFEPRPEASDVHPDTASSRLSRKFSSLVEEHYKQLHQVSNYADRLAVTPGHLNVVSKRWFNKTAGKVIQDRLLLEAKRLLLHSDLPGKEIAYALNFEDPSHFAKFFKSQCGVPPNEFRQQIREIYQR